MSLGERTESVKASVEALKTHWDTNAQKREQTILKSVEGRKSEIVGTLEAMQQESSKQHDQLQIAVDSIRTEFEEKHQKYSQEQNDHYEQTKAAILLAISAESEKLTKMLRISWAISGFSILGLITTLIVLLVD